VLSELRLKIQANNDEVRPRTERMRTWQLQKQQEERRIADAVSPFVSESRLPRPCRRARQARRITRPLAGKEEHFNVQAARTMLRSFFGFFISVAEDPN